MHEDVYSISKPYRKRTISSPAEANQVNKAVNRETEKYTKPLIDFEEPPATETPRGESPYFKQETENVEDSSNNDSTGKSEGGACGDEEDADADIEKVCLVLTGYVLFLYMLCIVQTITYPCNVSS